MLEEKQIIELITILEEYIENQTDLGKVSKALELQQLLLSL